MRLGIRVVVSSFLFFIAFPGGAFSQVEVIGESPGDRGILGWVIDARLGFPVINADISILDTLGELIGATSANEAGHFRLAAPDPGPYLLRVERLGYSLVESTVRYPGGVAQVLRISLSAQPIEVPGVEAMAHPGALHAEMTMGGFEARAARKAAGFFFQKEEIERRKPSRITDLVGRVPGVTVQRIGGRAVDIQVGHVPSLDFDRPCFPSVWLDGIPVREGGFQTEVVEFRREFLFLNDVIPPEQIGGIEVYTHSANLPAQFRGFQSMCGVVAIWTNRGGSLVITRDL